MKQSQNVPMMLSKFMAVLALCFLSVVTWAQDKGLDIDVDVDKGGEQAHYIIWNLPSQDLMLGHQQK